MGPVWNGDELGRTGMNWDGLGWDQYGTGMNWDELGRTGMNWDGLGWNWDGTGTNWDGTSMELE